jgi:hypothetical protein
VKSGPQNTFQSLFVMLVKHIQTLRLRDVSPELASKTSRVKVEQGAITTSPSLPPQPPAACILFSSLHLHVLDEAISHIAG